MKVLFITNIPSPYRVKFFNELGKKLNLTVLFEKDSSEERDNSWKKYCFDNFQGILMKGIRTSINTCFCPEVCRYLSRKWDSIIVADISTPTGMLAIQYMKLRCIPYWIEGDGGFAKSGHGLKELIKKHFISGAKGYFSTSNVHDKYYITYGANPKNIYRYPFTSISSKDLQNAYTLLEKDKNELREKLGMKEKYIVLSVGRFSYQNGYGKGYDVLMRVAEKSDDNFGFYIVGDEPTEEFKQWKAKKQLKHVHFIGFRQKEQLAEYYAAADVFALLSRGEAWGLVINEAMTFSLPIIASDQCVAATELVKNGVNGYVLPLDNEDEITEKIKDCAQLPHRQRMGKASLGIIESYTIEHMAEAHEKILGMIGSDLMCSS